MGPVVAAPLAAPVTAPVTAQRPRHMTSPHCNYSWEVEEQAGAWGEKKKKQASWRKQLASEQAAWTGATNGAGAKLGESRDTGEGEREGEGESRIAAATITTLQLVDKPGARIAIWQNYTLSSGNDR